MLSNNTISNVTINHLTPGKNGNASFALNGI
jgi:hypothetical protein